MKRILVVEDEHKLNDIICDYLGAKGYAVMQCFTGTDAVKAASRERFDLIMLDLMLPGMDGIQVARRVRETDDIPIIMLTARDSEADKILGLETGADDYITKPFSVKELEARIRAVLRRYSFGEEKSKTGGLIFHAGIELDPVKRLAKKNGKEITLTRAQFDLLSILLSEPGRVFTRSTLVEKVGGYEYEGYERTIDVHIKNIRKILEDDPGNPTILLTVWGIGYKIQE